MSEMGECQPSIGTRLHDMRCSQSEERRPDLQGLRLFGLFRTRTADLGKHIRVTLAPWPGPRPLSGARIGKLTRPVSRYNGLCRRSADFSGSSFGCLLRRALHIMFPFPCLLSGRGGNFSIDPVELIAVPCRCGRGVWWKPGQSCVRLSSGPTGNVRKGGSPRPWNR